MNHDPYICWSAGHGFESRADDQTDPGANVVTSKNDENDFALNMAKSLHADCKVLFGYGRRGHSMVRNGGRYYRADDDALKAGADYFIELHLNAGGGTGTEALYLDPRDKPFAANLSSAVAHALGLRDRGAKQRALAVLETHEGMRQVLLELFFDSRQDVVAHRRHRDAEVLAILNVCLKAWGWKPIKTRPTTWGRWRRHWYKPY
jgi:N-acetylmuramoyl-L-alanine amidase